MAKNLVVVESPAKARTVGRFLGTRYEVIASRGHVRDLPPSQLGVQVDGGFTPQYEVVKDKVKIVQELKKASKDAETIYLATDPDREGEAISWHLVKAAGWEKRTTRRVVFHEITQDAIDEAFRHPHEINMNLVNAQQARRILDRLVGYQLSPLLWNKISGGRRMGLSAGRVQSVALRLVVDREQEIEAFVPREYWTIKVNLEPEKRPEKGQQVISFSATLQQIHGRKGTLDLATEKQAQEVTSALEGAAYVVAKVQVKEVHQRPAAPFTTSTLQQEASRKLRFPARKTMSVAQQLYEGLSLGADSVGLITYMRTDSTHLAPAAVRETLAYIRQHYGDEYAHSTPRVYVTKTKGAQEAHEAIRPTSVERTPESLAQYLNQDQRRLYDLIWKRMMACQMTDAVLDSTRVDINAHGPNSQGHTYVFRATGSVTKFPGFRVLYSESRDDAQDTEESQPDLPPLEKDDPLRCLDLRANQNFTQPPPRYTEATLIRTLEEQGIGRPSTYAPTLAVIQDRHYVDKEQGRFKPTQLGKVVCGQLTSYFPRVMDIGFTATMEEELDDIAKGDKKWEPVLREFYDPFQEALNSATKDMPRVKVEEPTDEVCDLCGRPMAIKTSRFGRFLACTGFPECKGKKSILIKTGVACPKCEAGELVERRGKGRTFYGCTNYPECSFTVSRRPLPVSCPECKGILVASGRQTARCVSCDYRGPVPEQEQVEAGV